MTFIARLRGFGATIWGLFAAAALCAKGSPELRETRLLRFPATNGSEVAFSYAGQLYTVPVAGGTARRLTQTPGYAIFPRYSADGTQLAFTAQYEGNTEVYVMPSHGGVPRRLTYSATLNRDDLSDRMGPNNIVMAWYRQKPEVVFRSRWRSFDDFIGQLYRVGLEGDLATQLPVPRGGFLSFSPDDSRIAYNRVFREFRTWKRYLGGMADDIWIHDLTTGSSENITQHPAQDIFPMWAPSGRIYFASERTGRANLFVYDLSTKSTRQLTSFADFDVKFPSLGPDAIVFEQAGRIWRFDLKSEQAAPLVIYVQDDVASTRSTLVAADKYIQSLQPSPDGSRAVMVARGEVFTVPAKEGPTRALTRSSGAHERDAVWSPDGRLIAYISDATGENELYVRPQDGSGPAVQLTRDADTYYFAPAWSPDSRRLAWTDRRQRLRMVDTTTHAVTLVAENPEIPIREFDWSPDGAWIAWVKSTDRGPDRVVLSRVADGHAVVAASDGYGTSKPRFSDDGQWLLVSSSREFNPVYSDIEWSHAFQNMQRVYLIALARGTASPFTPKSDEVRLAPAPDTAAQSVTDSAGKDAPPPSEPTPPAAVKIDEEGLPDRIVPLPIAPSNYTPVRMIGDRVYYLRTPGAPQLGDGGGEGFSGHSGSRQVAAMFDLPKKKETELGRMKAFVPSKDGKKALVQDDEGYALIELPTEKVELKPEQRLKLSELNVSVDRRAEWTQIFHESWRQMRDFFYAPNFHGVDWATQRDKYAALLPHAATRHDLTYLIGEMIGELSVGHAYVGGGDRPLAPRIKTGLLGAEFSRDPASRTYRIDRILPGEPGRPGLRSPLADLGVDVREGEYILSVNNVPTPDLPNLYAALIDTVDKQVVLRVNGRPSEEGARSVTVVPIADESLLYYQAWIERNTAYVAERTGGRAGYIHIPDMGPEGLSAFMRRFYPQLGKQALIIDVRGNGGGNVSSMIIERLRREVDFVGLSRNGRPNPDPTDQVIGPKVTLLNEYSASDGDLFPFRFRKNALGPLVGKRSWGGVVGIQPSLPLVDGGSLFKPEFAIYAANGQRWEIEGHGVDPDLVVDNDPAREFRGEDQQLDAAIGLIMEGLKTRAPLAPPPAWPTR